MSILEDRLDKLIAADMGITPEEVTPMLMQEYRQKYIEPDERYELNSNTGGLNAPTPRVKTHKEIEKEREGAEAFLRKFSRK